MIFEPHSAEERQMAGAFVAMSPEDLTTFVAETTGLTVVKLLGEASDGRSVYHMSRPD